MNLLYLILITSMIFTMSNADQHIVSGTDNEYIKVDEVKPRIRSFFEMELEKDTIIVQ